MAPSEHHRHEASASGAAAAAEILIHLIDPPASKPPPQEEELLVTWQQKWTLMALQLWNSLPRVVIAISLLQVWVLVLLGDWGAQWLMYDPAEQRQVWRLISYMAVHTGATHLALNLLIQCLLAWPLEAEQPPLRVAMLYFAGGLAGSVGTAALEPGVSVMGASAGVYALLISHLAHLALNWSSVSYRVYRLGAVLVLVVADIAASLHHHFRLGNACPRVGWAAHSCGAFSGLLIGLLIYRQNGPVKPLAAGYIKSVRLLALFLLAAATGAAVVTKYAHLTHQKT